MRETNSLREEISLQQQKLKDQSFSKKAEYFWYYYKVHVVVIVFFACLFGSILHSILTQKETVLSIAYVNAFPNVEDEVFIKDFEDSLGLDPEKQQVTLDSTYYIDEESTSPYAATYSQKFSANAMAGKLDVVLADTENFAFYGNQGFFQNLENILPSEILHEYEDSLYYIDDATEGTTQKVPIGIKIDCARKILQTASYPHTEAYFGIVTGSRHLDNALHYLDFLEN